MEKRRRVYSDEENVPPLARQRVVDLTDDAMLKALEKVEAAPVDGDGYESSLPDDAWDILDQVERQLKPVLDYERYLVLQVDPNFNQRQKKLRIVPDKEQEISTEIIATLCDDWFDTDVLVGDIINIVFDDASDRGDIWITNQLNSLVLHPDILITPTSVTASFRCRRRAVLQSCLRPRYRAGKPALLGTLKHELFQYALTEEIVDVPSLYEKSHQLVQENLLQLLDAGLTEDEVIDQLRATFPDIITWIKSFLQSLQSSTSKNQVAFKASNNCTKTARISITRILATEEMMWSCKWGLKGSLDGTLEVEYVLDDDLRTCFAMVPLELKTGSRKYSELEHRSQTTLYTLLLEERYGRKGYAYDKGLLVYFPGPETEGILQHRIHLRGLISTRNLLASELIKLQQPGDLARVDLLPPMLRNLRDCEKCFSSSECVLYHAAAEGGTAESSGLDDFFNQKLAHLAKSDLEYFSHWNYLLDLELRRFRPGYRRFISHQNDGNTISNLHFVKTETSKKESLPIWTVTFENRQPVNDSLLSSRLRVGDTVVVSFDQTVWHVCNGRLIEMDATTLTIQLRAPMPLIRFFPWSETMAKSEQWKIHKDLLSTGMMRAKQNLLEMFMGSFQQNIALGVDPNRTEILNDSIGDERRRALIVHLEPPRFTSQVYFQDSNGPLDEAYRALNADQQHAVQKTMNAKDYCLVLGMPGTGKTSTIAFTIRALLSRGLSVLITSYTHSAVDNLLLKLLESDVPFLRLGSKASVHPQLQKYTLEVNHNRPITSIREMRHIITSARIVATSCLGIEHVLFNIRRFDYCIVDEASQITQPVVLGPLRSADTFILVGDHYQLPPLVTDPEARNGGLSISLFRRLSEAHPEALVNLTFQYRMNQEIMRLSNIMVYNNKLKCGSSSIAHQRLEIPKWNDRQSIIQSKWVWDVLTPDKPVLFANTDTILSKITTEELQQSLEERHENKQLSNRTEAVLVSVLVKGLLKTGVEPKNIGVISPYRAQVRVLKRLIDEAVEVSTVDKYQGRDKEVVIISLMRSNVNKRIGELLQDWRRLNVAFTRAKRKLVLVGSIFTLEGNPAFDAFLDCIQTEQWIYPLPYQCYQLCHDQIDCFKLEAQVLQEFSLSSSISVAPRASVGPKIRDIENLVPDYSNRRIPLSNLN